MIDPAKPLQLSDGTPVTLMSVGTHLNVLVPPGHVMSQDWHWGQRSFRFDGSRGASDFAEFTLQNVPETPAFDPTKPVQTRDGYPARIIATDAARYDGKTIVALKKVGSNEQAIFRFADGRQSRSRETCQDLINVPETKTVFVSLGDGFNVDANRDEAKCRDLAKDQDPYGFGVVKVVKQGGKLVSAELV